MMSEKDKPDNVMEVRQRMFDTMLREAHILTEAEEAELAQEKPNQIIEERLEQLDCLRRKLKVARIEAHRRATESRLFSEWAEAQLALGRDEAELIFDTFVREAGYLQIIDGKEMLVFPLLP
jgi:hypothetical protein